VALDFWRHDDFAGTTFLELPAGGFQNHFFELAVEWQGFRRIGQVYRLAVQDAAEVERSYEFAGLPNSILPAHLNSVVLLAFNVIANRHALIRRCNRSASIMQSRFDRSFPGRFDPSGRVAFSYSNLLAAVKEGVASPSAL
jgi:hypothetical protein